MPLKNHIKQALSGNADSLIVFLHGYGADGQDLLGLADALNVHLPNTIFMSPDAPNQSSVNPLGYEWFPIPRLDGSSLEQARISRDNTNEQLNLFLDKIENDTGIPSEKTFLFLLSALSNCCSKDLPTADSFITLSISTKTIFCSALICVENSIIKILTTINLKYFFKLIKKLFLN